MNTIRNAGYTLLSMPAADVQPLSLLEKTSKGVAKSMHAQLGDLFQRNDISVPEPSDDIELSESISNTEMLDLRVDAHFNLLQSLLSRFFRSAKADFTKNRTKNIEFKLNDPQKNTVNIVKVNGYLSGSQLSPGNESYLEPIQNGELYLVTEIIKTKSFSLQEEKKTATVAGGELATQPVEISMGYNNKNDKNDVMEHQGPGYLTIGIMAHKILYKEGKFTLKQTDEIEVVREGEFASSRMESSDGIISIEN